MNPADRLIVALDLPSAAEALALVDRLAGTCRWFKVGLELYLAAGPNFIYTLRSRGFEVFLDLKLHDIPNTAAAAVRSVAAHGASLLTVHALGGPAMLAAAAEAAASTPGAPRLLAVTVLTSMDRSQLASIGIMEGPATQVLRLAQLAKQAGINGLVCSAHEARALRLALGSDPLLITPGIRPADSDPGDQKRTSTPAEAIAAGASCLVVGRPITHAIHPAGAAAAILAEIARPSSPSFSSNFSSSAVNVYGT